MIKILNFYSIKILYKKEEKKTEEQEEKAAAEDLSKSINGLAWKKDGEQISKALVGDEVTLCADTHNIADGASATIKIVEKDADGNDDDVATLKAAVQNNTIECAWKVVFTADNDDTDSEQEKKEKGYTLPEYAFTIECSGEKSTESGQLDVYAKFICKLIEAGKVLSNYPYIIKLAGGAVKTGTTDKNGFVIENEILIGNVRIL